jgi:hypothetical protein
MGGAEMPGITSIVASRTLKPEDCPGATLIGDGLIDRVRELRAGSGKDIWLFGGGCCSGRCATPGWWTRSGSR